MAQGATPLEPMTSLAHLRRGADAFAALLEAGDLAAAVPSCPGWDLRALAHHLGNVHRWARGAVREGHPRTPEVDAPAAGPALVDWYRGCADALVTTLQEVDPGAEAWAFGPRPHLASFWHRRQALEAAVHLWDARQSQGEPGTIDAELAVDGVDEAVTMMFPRQVRLERIPPLEHSLALVAPHDVRWVLAGDGTGEASSPGATAEATVRGAPDALLLLVWRRLGLDDPRLSVDGDPAAAGSVLAAGITP